MDRLTVPQSASAHALSKLQMDWYPFTNEEKEVLLHSWKVLEPHKQALGCDIYEMIFNQLQRIGVEALKAQKHL
ncbi:hypothetical protein ANCDUO_18086, partial [Ancylostoma duodenale]